MEQADKAHGQCEYTVHRTSNSSLKKSVTDFFNSPRSAQVRVRLRRIKHFRVRFARGALSPRLSRLFFNSLLNWAHREKDRAPEAGEADRAGASG